MATTDQSHETISVTRHACVAHIELARPYKRNAMNQAFWKEWSACMDALSEDSRVRAVILSGQGKAFSSGLDLTDTGIDVFTAQGDEDAARRGVKLRKHVQYLQDAFTAVEKIPQPVIAAIHGACIGGAIDLVSACDVRYCSSDATFSIKEVAIGIAADVGTLQRLPRICGNHSLLRELAFTGRTFTAEEAVQLGLVSRVLSSAEETVAAAMELAKQVASRSPVAVYGTKANLLWARDHSVRDGLDYISVWNASALQTEDIPKAVTAAMQKRTPSFSKL